MRDGASGKKTTTRAVKTKIAAAESIGPVVVCTVSGGVSDDNRDGSGKRYAVQYSR